MDYYDYIGYNRNERFIMLRDYIEMPESNFLNALRNIMIHVAYMYMLGRDVSEKISEI